MIVENTPYIKTIESWTHQKVLSLKSLAYLKKFEERISVVSEHYNKKFEIKRYAQKERSKGVIFFIPGIFSGLDSIDVIRLSEILHKHGYETFVLPNPLSEDYYKFEPNFIVGDFVKEAEKVAEIIKEIKFRYSITKSDLIGISYGAYFSSMISNMLEFEKVILLSPPFHIGESLKIIDQHFEDHRWKLDTAQFSIVCKLLLSKHINSVPNLSEEEAKSFMWAACFHRSFQRLYCLHDSIKEKKVYSDFYYKLVNSQVAKELDDLRFIKAMKKLNPSFQVMRTEHSLKYWTDKLDQKSVWVIASQDDMINKDFYTLKDSLNLTLFDSGGHFGYREEEKFLKIFHDIFEI